MEEIIEKHVKKMMKRHPELTAQEATAIVSQFYSLARIAIDSYSESSNTPLIS